ncbi:OmpA/MotB family protein [Xanthobacter versatilis]|uniref:OmpA/MotB family protein n=1 Tax=Xanthobacter autotrophicus (strain ATCC BAA-1158 / Py2) TaxID=78245 RepID=UPI00372C647D
MAITEDTEHAGSEEGENYFISMTDMMVGVLFIFIIMLMVFALDFRTKTDVQEDAIEVAREVARKLDAMSGQVRSAIATVDASQQVRRQLLQDIESQLRAEGLNVQIDEQNGVLRLTEDAVRFEPSRSDLAGRARSNVDKIARVLDRVLPAYTACHVAEGAAGGTACQPGAGPSLETVFIEGHTDSTGEDGTNWQLSTERAVNTYRAIVAGAPRLRGLRNLRGEEILSVSGYASTRPIDPTESREAWARNRRIDLRFVMEVDNRRRLEEIRTLTDEMKQQIDRLTAASAARAGKGAP